MDFFTNNNIRIRKALFLSDGTTVAEYTKGDTEQIFVSIDQKEFGPFQATDIYISYSEKRRSTVKNYLFAGKEAGGKVRCFSKEKEITRLPKALEYADLPYRPKVEPVFDNENCYSPDDEDTE